MSKNLIAEIKTYKGGIRSSPMPYNSRQLISLIYYFFKWYFFLNRDPLKIKLPWITFYAISYLKKYVKRGMKVYEYGSGGSTKFFLSRKCEVHSIEHDRIWYEKVRESLTESMKAQHNYYLIEPEPIKGGVTLDVSCQDDYYSSDEKYSAMQFRKYVTSIDPYPNSYFDIVLIDGRARPSCIKHSMEKIKPGGLLILDNSEREYYSNKIIDQSIHDLFNEVSRIFGPLPYSEGFSETTIWKKMA